VSREVEGHSDAASVTNHNMGYAVVEKFGKPAERGKFVR